MSEIVVNGRIKVKSFYIAFNKAYPYLHASLRVVGRPRKGVDPEATIASARALEKYAPTKEVPLSVRGNLKLATFEKRFEEQFGIVCMIHYWKDGKWKRPGAKHLQLTLSQANAQLEAAGAEPLNLSKHI
ncbi:MAG: hypothetical protein RBT71_12315 [Flavobacteriales bacterium]|jgi:hypothetical protein|nr:hypothetical protein [Flavobacteriales bacterium]